VGSETKVRRKLQSLIRTVHQESTACQRKSKALARCGAKKVRKPKERGHASVVELSERRSDESVLERELGELSGAFWEVCIKYTQI
jgi:hypothetical protein